MVEVERIIGQGPPIVEGLVPAGSPGELKVDLPYPEVLDPAKLDNELTEKDNPGESQERRYRLSPLIELDLNNMDHLEAYYRMLSHPNNKEHFSSPPKNVDDLKQKLLRDSTHAYIAQNREGRIIGAGGINDAAEGEHDHFLVKVVVDPDYQSTEDIRGRKVGRQLVIQLIEKAFFTRASDGRTRFKLDAAIIGGVRGWERMPDVLESLGFHFRSRLPGQVDVYDPRQYRTIRRPTFRWEIERDEWMRARRRTDIKNMLQQEPQQL